MSNASLKMQKLIALFILGVIAFNGPFLSLFNRSTTVWGIPVLFFYLFSVWAVLILLTGLVIEYRRIKSSDNSRN